MAERTPGEACPWLGAEDDPQTRWMFPSPRQFCWSPQRPRGQDEAGAGIELDTQKALCLSGGYPTCPHYVDPPPRPEVEPIPARTTGIACPALGGRLGASDYNTSPSPENVCYSAAAPRRWWQRYYKVTEEHQRQYCLGENYRSCEYYEA